MGWLYMSLSRQELIRRLIAPRNDETAWVETIAHEVQDDILWSVEQFTARQKTSSLNAGQSRKTIVCYLLDAYGGKWGYKALDESMHPYYYSCPLRFLDLAPEQSREWRAGVRACHAQQTTALAG